MTSKTGGPDISSSSDRPMLPYDIGARFKCLLFEWMSLRWGTPFRTASAVINYRDGISFVDILKPPPMDETKLMIDYLAASEIFDKRLWDFSKVEWPYSNDQIIEFAQYGSSKFQQAGRMALLVNNDLGAGTGQVFAKHREAGQLTYASVFRSESKAIAWLNGEDESD